MMTDLKTDLTLLIEPIAEGEGFDLVEIKLARFKRSYRVQVFIDIAGGITIAHCARLSSLIGTALEVADLIPGPYVLEVSSPGLDRPLRSAREFERKIGQRVRIVHVENSAENTTDGLLTTVAKGTLTLSNDDGTVEIALTKVLEGKVII